MAGIRSRDSGPELAVRRYLHRKGFRFRLHDRELPGRPDLVLPKWRAVIQVHGCFWHAHEGCRYFRVPETRREFWTTKLLGNRERDRRTSEALVGLGWRVAVVWECSLRSGEDGLEQLGKWITSAGDSYVEVAGDQSATPAPH